MRSSMPPQSRSVDEEGVLIDDFLLLSQVARAEMELETVDLSAVVRAIGAENLWSNMGTPLSKHISSSSRG